MVYESSEGKIDQRKKRKKENKIRKVSYGFCKNCGGVAAKQTAAAPFVQLGVHSL